MNPQEFKDYSFPKSIIGFLDYFNFIVFLWTKTETLDSFRNNKTKRTPWKFKGILNSFILYKSKAFHFIVKPLNLNINWNIDSGVDKEFKKNIRRKNQESVKHHIVCIFLKYWLQIEAPISIRNNSRHTGTSSSFKGIRSL